MPRPLTMSWGSQQTTTVDGGQQDDLRGKYTTTPVAGIEGGDDDEYVITTVQEHQKQTRRRSLLSLCFLVACLATLAACVVVAAVVLEGGDISWIRNRGNNAPDSAQFHPSPSGGDDIDQKADAIVNGLFELINKYCISEDPDDIVRCQEACSPGECCFVKAGGQDNDDCSMTAWCMEFAKCQAVYNRESELDNP